MARSHGGKKQSKKSLELLALAHSEGFQEAAQTLFEVLCGYMGIVHINDADQKVAKGALCHWINSSSEKWFNKSNYDKEKLIPFSSAVFNLFEGIRLQILKESELAKNEENLLQEQIEGAEA